MLNVKLELPLSAIQKYFSLFKYSPTYDKSINKNNLKRRCNQDRETWPYHEQIVCESSGYTGWW